jgi:hypothetical protein
MKFIGHLLGQHLARYPRMELADLYKLLHQAAMGAGHAVQDPETARAMLRSEAQRLGDGPPDPVADPISPDGKLARVHLRAYAATRGDTDALADAFLETARRFTASREKLEKFCACLGDLADARGIPFSRVQVSGYFDVIAAQDYPVVRHSEAYRAAYRPAYRVVLLDLLPGLVK